MSVSFCPVSPPIQIPLRQGRIVIPSLFAAYFLTWIVDIFSPSERTTDQVNALVLVEEDEKVEIKPWTNGHSSKLDITVTDTVSITVCSLKGITCPVSTKI